jgi:hypothetical protein
MGLAIRSNEPETALEDPLLNWLLQRRRIRADTLVARELFWHGRRIDVVTLTKTGVATAYELKLRHMRRALEQSSLNGVSFDRSCIVTASRPAKENLAQAEALGLGVMLVNLATDRVHLLLRPVLQDVGPVVRLRLRRQIESCAGGPYVR